MTANELHRLINFQSEKIIVNETFENENITAFFHGMIFYKCTFINCNLPGQINSTYFKHCTFKNCILCLGNWISNSCFLRCWIENCDFSHGGIEDTNFSDCWFTGEIHLIDSKASLLSNIKVESNYKTVTNKNEFLDNLSRVCPPVCPREGSFIGWKKSSEKRIIKLLIPEDAKRSNGFSRKCRCNKAKVLDIFDENGEHYQEARSSFDNTFTYEINEDITIANFDENRFNECAPGIHFFMTIEEAFAYSV